MRIQKKKESTISYSNVIDDIAFAENKKGATDISDTFLNDDM